MSNEPGAADLQIVTTADGSVTIWNGSVGEHYHSRNGALQESKHVFLNAGLKHFIAKRNTAQVSILEVGFGTGLNFLLSANYTIANHIDLNYTGIEAYPLSAELISATGYGEYINNDIWSDFLDKYPKSLSGQVQLHPNVSLYIAVAPLQNFESDDRFDIIYFDAFGSAHQPEMWTEQAISHTVKFLKPGGIFVTYAITGQLKRILKGLGLSIEKLPGAPGKREMLRATL